MAVVYNYPGAVQGPQGVPGSDGAVGMTGPTGATGATGAQGVAGPTGAAGTAGATGAQGTAGTAGSSGATGAQGPSGFSTITPSTPARSLNAVFQPNATKAVDCSYSISITCTATLTGGQTGKVELFSDAVNPPTTLRSTLRNSNSVSLAIALTAVNEQTSLLNYLVPIGHYVKLLTTNVLGTPTFSMISQSESVLG